MSKIDEIKQGLDAWDNKYPLHPFDSKMNEMMHDVVKLRAKAFEQNAVEYVRFLLKIIENNYKPITFQDKLQRDLGEG